MSKRRLLSWLWDYLVCLGILTIVFLVVGVPTLLGWIELDEIWEDPVLSDLALTCLTLLPFLAYLTATEAGERHATWGKRRESLHVTRLPSGPPRFGQVLGRDTLKLLPWQFGHMAAARFANPEGNLPLAITFFSLSIATLVAVAGPPLFGKRGLHEVVSKTSVDQTREVSSHRPLPTVRDP